MADPTPLAPISPELAGAILALGMAADETTARYWLAMCARRGAAQPLLDRLWSAWAALNAPQVIHSDPTPSGPWRCICGSGDDGEWHTAACAISNTPDDVWNDPTREDPRP